MPQLTFNGRLFNDRQWLALGYPYIELVAHQVNSTGRRCFLFLGPALFVNNSHAFHAQVYLTMRRKSSNTTLCTVLTCRKSDGKARVANVQCEKVPPQCAQCCKLAGGCHVHRVAGSALPPPAEPPLAPITPLGPVLSVPLTDGNGSSGVSATAAPFVPAPAISAPTVSAPAVSAPVVPAPVVPAPVVPAPTVPAMVPIAKTYARPLDSTYGRGWATHPRMLAVTQHVDANDAMAESLRSTFCVVLWTKAGLTPEVLRLKTTLIGRFTPVDHPVLMSSLSDTTIISVYCTTPIPTWVKQDLSTPVEFEGSRVLIRAGALDCKSAFGLEDELRASASHGKRKPDDVEVQGVSSLKRRRVTTALDHTTTSLSTSSTLLAPLHALPSTSSLVPSRGRSEETVFPRTYVSDMLCMVHFIGISGPRDLAGQFSKYFPGTKFVLKTLYKHRSYYSEGKEMNILQEKMESGASRPWSAVTTLVEQARQQARGKKEKGEIARNSTPDVVSQVHDSSSSPPETLSLSPSGHEVTTPLSQTDPDDFLFSHSSFSTSNLPDANNLASEGATGELDISQFLQSLDMTGFQNIDPLQEGYQTNDVIDMGSYFDFSGGNWI
ncbi:hypothetical protein BU15DRAFT_62360 [Melanogaster broomeanus]|nr:hypothetical protein BU15DRAFT_62360 [Melanogaster broomeanus]